MKRFLTCALCFVSLPAVAVTLYYDTEGICEGLHVGPTCDTATVSHLNVMAYDDTDFDGYSINGQQIVDQDGNISPDAVMILRSTGISAGTKVIQSYGCQGNLTKNNNNICIDDTGNTTYIDFENGDEDGGYEVLPTELGGEKGTNACVHSKFKVKIHWCPPKYGAYPAYGNGSGWNPYSTPTVPANFGYPELWPEDCENGDDITEVLYYEWKDRTSLTPGKATYRTGSYAGTTVKTQLDVPKNKFDGWTLRGFYLQRDGFTNDSGNPGYYDNNGQWVDCPEGLNQTSNLDCYTYWGKRNYFAKWRVVSENNIDGTARLGLPKPNGNPETGYIDLNDLHDGSNGAWTNTRWAIYDCTKTDEEMADTTVHLYAGWAKDCVAPENGTCGLEVKRTGLSQNNNKGDVFYSATCDDGTTPTGYNTYAASCPEQPQQITYDYAKYMDTEGNNIPVKNCTGVPTGGTCAVGDTVQLATPTDLSCSGGNYRFARWYTQGGTLHQANDSVQCAISVLGTGTPTNITGVMCNCDITYTPSGSVQTACMSICESVAEPLKLGTAFVVGDDIVAAETSN